MSTNRWGDVYTCDLLDNRGGYLGPFDGVVGGSLSGTRGADIQWSGSLDYVGPMSKRDILARQCRVFCHPDGLIREQVLKRLKTKQAINSRDDAMPQLHGQVSDYLLGTGRMVEEVPGLGKAPDPYFRGFLAGPTLTETATADGNVETNNGVSEIIQFNAPIPANILTRGHYYMTVQYVTAVQTGVSTPYNLVGSLLSFRTQMTPYSVSYRAAHPYANQLLNARGETYWKDIIQDVSGVSLGAATRNYLSYYIEHDYLPTSHIGKLVSVFRCMANPSDINSISALWNYYNFSNFPKPTYGTGPQVYTSTSYYTLPYVVDITEDFEALHNYHYNKEKSYPVGTFLMVPESEDIKGKVNHKKINLYDKTTKLKYSYELQQGKLNYTAGEYAGDIIEYNMNWVDESGLYFRFLKDDIGQLNHDVSFELKAARLDVVNSILANCNYTPIHCDGWGSFKAESIPAIKSTPRLDLRVIPYRVINSFKKAYSTLVPNDVTLLIKISSGGLWESNGVLPSSSDYSYENTGYTISRILEADDSLTDASDPWGLLDQALSESQLGAVYTYEIKSCPLGVNDYILTHLGELAAVESIEINLQTSVMRITVRVEG